MAACLRKQAMRWVVIVSAVWCDGLVSKRFIKGPAPASRQQVTRSILICCVILWSTGQTRPPLAESYAFVCRSRGVSTWRISRWSGVFSIWSWWWIGSIVTCWVGGSRPACMPISAWTPSKGRWTVTASLRSSTLIKAPSSPARCSPPCCSMPRSRSAWTARIGAWITFFIERLWRSLKCRRESWYRLLDRFL